MCSSDSQRKYTLSVVVLMNRLIWVHIRNVANLLKKRACSNLNKWQIWSTLEMVMLCVQSTTVTLLSQVLVSGEAQPVRFLISQLTRGQICQKWTWEGIITALVVSIRLKYLCFVELKQFQKSIKTISSFWTSQCQTSQRHGKITKLTMESLLGPFSHQDKVLALFSTIRIELL